MRQTLAPFGLRRGVQQYAPTVQFAINGCSGHVRKNAFGSLCSCTTIIRYSFNTINLDNVFLCNESQPANQANLLESHQALLEREECRLRSRGETEFREQARDVRFNRVLG